jgi:hypothetical protein
MPVAEFRLVRAAESVAQVERMFEVFNTQVSIQSINSILASDFDRHSWRFGKNLLFVTLSYEAQSLVYMCKPWQVIAIPDAILHR